LKDLYVRFLAYVFLPDGRMVNEQLIELGYAISVYYPPNGRHRQRLGDVEEGART